MASMSDHAKGEGSQVPGHGLQGDNLQGDNLQGDNFQGDDFQGAVVGRVLLVEDDEGHVALIRRTLRANAPAVSLDHVASLSQARDRLGSRVHDLALVDIRLPDGSGLDLLDPTPQHIDRVPVVVMTSQGREELAVEAMKRGALDYVVKSADVFPGSLAQVIGRALREVAHIRERWRAEETARRLAGQYRVLYDEAPAMFFTVDNNAKIISANAFGAKRMGYPTHTLIGHPVTVLYPEAERDQVLRALAALGQDPNEVRRWEIRKLCRDGSSFWARETARAVHNGEGTLHTLMVCEDISDAHELAEQLAYQATHDALTGLVNRPEFERRLARVLESLEHTPSHHVLCYLDLDQFKLVNDTCGHSAGDELLRQLAQRLCRRVRKRDTFARLGGDEFGVLMEHCTAEQGLRVAESLRRGVVENQFSWEGSSFTLGASLGLVPIPENGASLAEVMSAADVACYAAKDAGRNRVHLYRIGDAALDRWRGEMNWVSRLKEAIATDRLALSMQPIVAMSDKIGAGGSEVRRCELLLRMIDENGQTILPGAFLPAAERYNFVTILDRWVVDRSFAWLSGSGTAPEELELCFINLSGRSVIDPEFCPYVIERLHHYGIDPAKVCFEITETAAIGNLAAASELMDALGGLGCRFALDDFGSGLSSFPYLKHLPVDFIKIDGSFVRDSAEDAIDCAMVRSINDIGHILGKETIAEFVETPRVLEVVRDLGIDHVQGYAVGRPVLCTHPHADYLPNAAAE